MGSIPSASHPTLLPVLDSTEDRDADATWVLTLLDAGGRELEQLVHEPQKKRSAAGAGARAPSECMERRRPRRGGISSLLFGQAERALCQ